MYQPSEDGESGPPILPLRTWLGFSGGREEVCVIKATRTRRNVTVAVGNMVVGLEKGRSSQASGDTKDSGMKGKWESRYTHIHVCRRQQGNEDVNVKK